MNDSRKFNFTKQRLSKLVPESKEVEYRDTGQKGLTLRVTKNGGMIFRFFHWSRIKKRDVKITIGRYPEMGISDAREISSNYLFDLGKGIDTAERHRIKREELVLDDVFQIWVEEHAKLNIKRWDQEQRRYELYIGPYLGKKKLSDITPDSIRSWKLALSKRKKERSKGNISPGMVHRAFITLSSIFGKGARHMLNPCSLVDKIKAKRRTVFMGTDHLNKFFGALDHIETPAWLKDYLLISLYTGARRSNVLAMNWGQIHLDIKIWIIPGDETKNEEEMVIPLLDQVIEILSRRKKSTSSIFIFPSTKSRTGHLVEPKKAWKALLDRAGLDRGYRLHDIRRTIGSWQAISGSSTKLIGASSGHKSPQAAEHYAHLTIEPVRASMERVATAMDNAKNIPDKIVKITKG